MRPEPSGKPGRPWGVVVTEGRRHSNPAAVLGAHVHLLIEVRVCLGGLDRGVDRPLQVLGHLSGRWHVSTKLRQGRGRGAALTLKQVIAFSYSAHAVSQSGRNLNDIALVFRALAAARMHSSPSACFF